MPPPQFAQRPPGQGAPQFMPPAGFRPGMPPQRPGMPPPGMPPPGVSRNLFNCVALAFLARPAHLALANKSVYMAKKER